MRSLNVNVDQDSLLGEMELIEEATKPLKREIDRCKEEANVSASRAAWSFTFIILT